LRSSPDAVVLLLDSSDAEIDEAMSILQEAVDAVSL